MKTRLRRDVPCVPEGSRHVYCLSATMLHTYIVGANFGEIRLQTRKGKSLRRDAYCSIMWHLRAGIICIWAEEENNAVIVKICSLKDG